MIMCFSCDDDDNDFDIFVVLWPCVMLLIGGGVAVSNVGTSRLIGHI